MSHRTLLTATGFTVRHFHSMWKYRASFKTREQAATLASYPGIHPVRYVHLDHTAEELLPTEKYNCWGLTFNPRQCWISFSVDVQKILDDNGTRVYAPNLRIGDVICYKDDKKVVTHTGRVWSVNSSGQASLIQSKWGSLGEYLHPPLTVPANYGTNLSFWRVAPLVGKGDAWLKDNVADDRLPYPSGVRWLSPSLWCNRSGATTHQDPVRGRQNQLYARVHNPDTIEIKDASVRFYWADPSGGIPHADWKPIGSASVAVAPGSSAVAGPVSWTPGASVPAHTCLFAIADTGDDPFAASTLDPIAWPFDVARDNNVAQRSVAVVAVPPKPMPTPRLLPFTAVNPEPLARSVEVRIDMWPVDARDLGELGLDWQADGPLAHEVPRLRSRPRTVIRPRPGITLDVETEGDAWRSEGGRVQSRGLILTTEPVPFGGGGALKLTLNPNRAAREGQLYRIDLEQRVGGTVTGGMTYVVVVAAEMPEGPPAVAL